MAAYFLYHGIVARTNVEITVKAEKLFHCGAQRACPQHALANSEHGSALQQPYLPLTMDEGQRHQIKKYSTAVFSQALALPEF